MPFAHAGWLAAHVAGVRAHLVEGEEHLSLMLKAPAILQDLRQLGGMA